MEKLPSDYTQLPKRRICNENASSEGFSKLRIWSSNFQVKIIFGHYKVKISKRDGSTKESNGKYLIEGSQTKVPKRQMPSEGCQAQTFPITIPSKNTITRSQANDTKNKDANQCFEKS